jgi:subtilisin family serine protease
MKFACHALISLVWCIGSVLVEAEGPIQHRKLITAPFGKAVSGRYIIVLNGKVRDVRSKAKVLLQNSGATIDFEYGTVFEGLAVNGLAAKYLTSIIDDDMILSVEEDQIFTVNQSFEQTQSNPENWGLDRIDKRLLPLDNAYGYTYTGKGVYIFIMDTGIYLSHNEFGGRAVCDLNLISFENCDDKIGHGSHVAGLAAGAKVSSILCFYFSVDIVNLMKFLYSVIVWCCKRCIHRFNQSF